MDWSNERYVRVYVRDTKTWLKARWQGQALFMMLLRKVDRSGILDNIDDPIDDLELITGLPAEHVAIGYKNLINLGAIEQNDETLLIPNFIEAQEAVKSDKQRQREYRERRRDDAKKQGDYEQYMRDYRRQTKAHKLVAKAIKDGELSEMPCEECGATKNVVAHHEDYDKPLDVVWLCKKHHSAIHQETTKRDEKSREQTQNNANKREATPYCAVLNSTGLSNSNSINKYSLDQLGKEVVDRDAGVVDLQKAQNQREAEERQKNRQVLVDQVNDFGPGQLKKTKRKKHEYTTEFERVWVHWGNPSGKLDASKAYEKAKKNGLPPEHELIAIIQEQHTWPKFTNDNGEYIPHFATWINGHRWEDQRPKVIRDNNDLPINQRKFANDMELPD